MKTKKLPLAFWIFVGLVAGIAAGLILMAVPDGGQIAIGYIKPWGDIFLNLLKFIVVPIVLFSIAAGVISMRIISQRGFGRWARQWYIICVPQPLRWCWP